MTRYINPKRQWVGAFIPNWLCIQRSVSPNAKIVYARLMQYCDEEGKAWPLQETLARSVGMEIRTLQRALTELVEVGLLHKHQRGRNKSNYYRFPTHEWMVSTVIHKDEDESVDNSAPAQKGHDKSVTPDTTDMSGPDTTDMSHIKEADKTLIRSMVQGATRAMDANRKNDVPQPDRRMIWKARIEKEITATMTDRKAERLIRDYDCGVFYAKQAYEVIDKKLKAKRRQHA